MTRDSLTIADYPTDPIEIYYQKYGRHGRYKKATLFEKFGIDVLLPEQIGLVTSDCGYRGRLGNLGCGAIYPGLMRAPKYFGV